MRDRRYGTCIYDGDFFEGGVEHVGKFEASMIAHETQAFVTPWASSQIRRIRGGVGRDFRHLFTDGGHCERVNAALLVYRKCE